MEYTPCNGHLQKFGNLWTPCNKPHNHICFFSEGLGCQIFAYDHTINNVPSRRGEQIFYFKTGMGFGENLKSLSTLIAENKHKNDTIDYLKVYVCT